MSDPGLDKLDAGERAAIALAQIQADDVLLLIDEVRGRSAASQKGLAVTGTLGILDLAAEKRLLDLPSAIDRLRETNFHVAPVLLKRLLDRDLRRR